MIRREYAKILDNAPSNRVCIKTLKGGYTTYVNNISWVKGGIMIRTYGVYNSYEDIRLSSRMIKQIYF